MASNIVWSAAKGWHDGPAAQVVVDGGRWRAEPVVVECECADVDPWVGYHANPECPLYVRP